LVVNPDSGPPAAAQPTLLLLRLLGLALGIVMILQAFKVQEILEDHLEDSGSEDVRTLNFARASSQLSGLATFFLSAFYLQYVINQRIAAPRDADPTSPAS
jgi:hypothetical protein